MASSPAGIRQEGYLDEVDGLTPETLTEAYREMLRTASIELLVLGCGEAETDAGEAGPAGRAFRTSGGPRCHCARTLPCPGRMPVRRVECFDTVQAKLCMLFTLGVPMRPDQMAAVRLAMALYGGSVTSRLFLNVRERRSFVLLLLVQLPELYRQHGCEQRRGARRRGPGRESDPEGAG